MKRLLILTALPAFFLLACNKEPGQGGLARISGKLYRIEQDVLGQTIDEYYDADQDVYIIYGTDDNVYDDKFQTSFDGSFEFTNLTPGTYTIFAYSRCDNCVGDDTTVSQVVEITDKKQDIQLEDLITYK